MHIAIQFALNLLTYDDSHLWSDIRHNDVKGTSSNMDVSERRVMMLRFTVFVFLLIHVSGEVLNRDAANGQLGSKMVDGKPDNILKPGAFASRPADSHPRQTHQPIPPVDKHKMSAAKPEGVKPPAIRLSETKECGNDIIKHCNPKIYKNNFAILDCLQNDFKVNTHFLGFCMLN